MSCKGELIRINGTIPDDPAISRVIKDFQKQIPPPPPPTPPASAAAPAQPATK